MLIICSGPDTWHARRKASELVAAFRAKHDPDGLSTEVVRVPVDLKSLLNQLGTPSLFSKKRLIRCDGLLDELKIADVRALAKRLKDDADQTVLLSVEQEPLTSKVISEFKETQFFHYDYPLLQGAAFKKWCVVRGQELGVSPTLAEQIALRADGDVWLAEQELMKCSANPHAPLRQTESDEGSVFDLADKFLTDKSGWRESIARADDPQVSVVLASQSRAALRVKDGESGGIHPYVAKKISQMRIPSPTKKLLRALRALVGARQGVANTNEIQTLL